MTLASSVALVLLLTQTPGQPAPGKLEGTAWRAVELAGMTVPTEQTAGREPHLVLDAGGRMSGSDGCNRFTGSYTEKANGITFGQMASTRMLCPDNEEIVRRFLGAMKGTSHWSIVGGRLELYGATGKPLAVFERRSPTKPKI